LLTAWLTAIREVFPEHLFWWGREEGDKDFLFGGRPSGFKFINIEQTSGWLPFNAYVKN